MSQNSTKTEYSGEVFQVSSYSQRHPNFFIVGAAKSGTTSLWMYLKQHSDIYMPQTIKEPSFFCNLHGYRDFDAYLRLFADANGSKAVGEASHAYLTSPESAAWIREVYPEARIIIILRNPAERAYSLYNWMIREGYEWIYPFEKALIAEKDRLANQQFKHHNPQYYYNYLYFNSGCYAAQVERYLEVFPRKQIQVILFEDLKANSVATTQRIYDFLGVDTSFTPQLEVYNKSQTPFSVPVQYFIKQKLPKYLYKFRIPAVGRIQQTAFATNLFLGRGRSTTLSAATRRNLQERYREDIQKTASLIDRDLRAWLTGS